MEKIRSVKNSDDAARLLTVALEHEWAVSFEYVIHAYSMPKGQFFYDDPILKNRTDMRAQTIQIGIDEMYHALQIGIILTQMGVRPTFKTDEVLRYPRIIDNLKRDKMTEDLVTDLYQSAEVEAGAFPKIENMIWNISYDEVRHSRQFEVMIETLEAGGNSEAPTFKAHPERGKRDDLRILHEICRIENELMHRYLKHVMAFSEHQDLSQRLYKNSINHMRHWDKLAGILVKMGDVIAIENAETDGEGVEKSLKAMPEDYPGTDRMSALEALAPSEKDLVALYERALPLFPEGEILNQLRLHLGLAREHVFTQEALLANARKIKGLA
jgi:bacterioferritin (cytochrome b1)